MGITRIFFGKIEFQTPKKNNDQKKKHNQKKLLFDPTQSKNNFFDCNILIFFAH